MPTETLMNTTKIIATTLTREKHVIIKENQTFQGRHGEALQQLAKQFGANAEKLHQHQQLQTKPHPHQQHQHR